MKDGRAYITDSEIHSENVVGTKKFCFAVIGLVHGHVNGMIRGLCEAGATISCLWDDCQERIEDFVGRFGACRVLDSPEDVFKEDNIDLVVNCLRPDVRAKFSCECLCRGISVFSDKPGFLTLKEGDEIRCALKTSKARYCIYFSEHFHHEGMIQAQKLADEGFVGRVFNYIGMAPHRLNPQTRPSWFFDPKINGDIVLDLGCHLVEQFLTFTGNTDARIVSCVEANLNNKEHPEFFDTGSCTLVGENGAVGHIHVDWFTPDGIETWGDCRAFVYGTEGEIEVRKYCNLGLSEESDLVLFANNKEAGSIKAHNRTGFDFFGKFILDCMNKSEVSKLKQNNMELSLFCIKAMELSVEASLMRNKH